MSTNLKTPYFKNNKKNIMRVTSSVKNISNKNLPNNNNNINDDNNEDLKFKSSENNFHSSNDSNKFE